MRPHLLACTAALVLVACSDDPAFDAPPASGGGAGDAAEDAATLAPFVGTYDLTGPWQGELDDEAYLVIGQPDASGEARAALYDFDELDGCYEAPRSGSTIGTLRVDDFGGGVFLDGLLSFEEATASLGAGGALELNYNDVEDIDGDGNRSERTSYVATRTDGLAEMDLQPRC